MVSRLLFFFFLKICVSLPNGTKHHALCNTGEARDINSSPPRHKDGVVWVSVLEHAPVFMLQSHAVWQGEIYLHAAMIKHSLLEISAGTRGAAAAAERTG